MAGGHPNVYLYCANDPVNGKDPSGLQDEYGGFWYHFFRELLKGETWTHGINTGLAATGSAFTFGLWDGGTYRNEVGFETSFLLAGVGRDCLMAAGGAGAAKSLGIVGQISRIPTKVRKVLTHLKSHNFTPPKGFKGNKVFHNREGKLPSGGSYREYDIDPCIKGVSRGPERIVVDVKSGRSWYTPDHYKSFFEVK